MKKACLQFALTSVALTASLSGCKTTQNVVLETPTTPDRLALLERTDYDVCVPYDTMPVPLNYKAVLRQVRYPEEARADSVGGFVAFKVLFDEQGYYVKHVTLMSPDVRLSQAVEPFLGKLRVKLAKMDGQAVAAWLHIPYMFHLKEPPISQDAFKRYR